jgi:eukaryotic-like serine/threonine-protein kinase
MDKENSLSKLSNYIRENNGFESIFGHININVSDSLGQGGNGIVYSGKINDVDVAVKFLFNYNSQKLERFKAEYLNINLVKERLANVVNCIHFGVVLIENIDFPYIIMKKYKSSLKKYRQSLREVIWEDVYKLFKDLSVALQALEQCGIIHRDLKPENILVDDNNNYIITDFGIAHFEADDFPIKDLTKKGERLANFEFSAPEQIKGLEVSYATDIYSFAQIIYWFVFGEVNRGVGGRQLQEIFDGKDAGFVNSIVYKCLNNNPKDRLQTIEDINEKILDMRKSSREINPFDDMHELSRIVRSTVPEFYRKGGFTEDADEIRDLMIKINNAKLNRPLEFNTGSSNNPIDLIIPLENGNYLFNQREIKIVRIWGLFGDSNYNDILILETDTPEPYIIDGKEYYGIAVINGNTHIPADDIESGYIRYKGKVYHMSELEIQERYIYPDEQEKFYVIGAFASCTIISKNDKYIKKLQECEKLDRAKLVELKNKISENKSENIYMYL